MHKQIIRRTMGLEGIGEILKVAGAGALFFIAWFLVQKSQEKQIGAMEKNVNTLLENQSLREAETRKNEREMWLRILDEQSSREARSFQLLQQMLERMDYHSGTLSRLEQKIDTKWSCPIIREGVKG